MGRNKNRAKVATIEPTQEVAEIKESIRQTVNEFESPLVDKEVLKDFVETEIGKIEESNIVNLVAMKALGLTVEQANNLRKEVGNDGLLEMSENEVVHEDDKMDKLVDNLITTPEFQETENELLKAIVKGNLSNRSIKADPTDDGTEVLRKAVAQDIENEGYLENIVIETSDVLSHYPTVLDYFKAQLCTHDSVDLIPVEYVRLHRDTNIIQSIDFLFMTSFADIKGDIDYCTVDATVLHGTQEFIPARYNIIQHEMTTEVKFVVDGEYHVKSIFDESLSNLVSSLFNNHKIEK